MHPDGRDPFFQAEFAQDGTTPGTSDSPTMRSGRRPSSNTVASTPRIASSDASASPDGPPSDDSDGLDTFLHR